MGNKVDYEITRINELNRQELIAEYMGMFQRDPPASISQGLLKRVICYEIRLKAAGGLTPEQKKLFAKVIKEDEPKRGRIWDHRTQFKTGTRLRRLWKGKTYQVVCEAGGFRLDDQTYKSLSEVARAITGTRWNGYVFFGLRSPKAKEAAHAAA